jgi:hypothetical protein
MSAASCVARRRDARHRDDRPRLLRPALDHLGMCASEVFGALFSPIRSSGAVMNVVITATITSMKNAVELRMPTSSPTLITISAIRAPAFISTPIMEDARSRDRGALRRLRRPAPATVEERTPRPSQESQRCSADARSP